MSKELAEALFKKITYASNYINDKRKRGNGRCIVTTSEGKVVDIIDD